MPISDILPTYFQALTGFTPRQFQQQAIANLLNRQDVLLRAPTGSGKTETAIAPFLFAQALNLDFPQKLIYVVPLRTLANSLRQRTEDLVQRWQHHYPSRRPLAVTLQTGENPEDPRFEGDIIFCTIDQLLSSFLNIPYSVGRGSANINAGVAFAAYLVFDELHLLDPQRSFTTTLKVLEQVRGISPFLLMTATLTDALATTLQQAIALGPRSTPRPLQVLTISDADLASIEGNRERTLRAVSGFLKAQTILADIQEHQRQRVIVICNTVSQSQGLFHDLVELDRDNKLTVTLLHARFLPEDRAAKEQHIQGSEDTSTPGEFAQHWQGDHPCHVLIATQVIEAGINITCQVMHVQLCPMNSLLQRAGRCARFRGEQGEVRVYREVQISLDQADLANADWVEELEETTPQPQKRRPFLPYPTELCEDTWAVLQAHTASAQANQPVGFRTEAAWINAVHQSEDALHAEQRQAGRMAFDQQFRKAFFEGDQAAASALIRQVDSRSIYVWEESPLIFDGTDAVEIDPRQLVPFSLPTSVLCGVFRRLTQLENGVNRIFKAIEPPKHGETYSQPICVPIRTLSDLKSSPRILVNPQYVHYDPDIGLRLGGMGNGFQSPNKAQRRRAQEYRYHMDTYEEHLGRLWTRWRQSFQTQVLKNGTSQAITYPSVRAELLSAGQRFIQTRLFPGADDIQAANLFEYLVFLAIWLHDLGKLQRCWQAAMRGWQQIAHTEFGGQDPANHLLAHTDYDPDDATVDANHRTQKQRLRDYEKQSPRPNHAVESAFLAEDILEVVLAPLLAEMFQASDQQVDALFQVVLLAVGRHHAAWTQGWGTREIANTRQIELHPQAQRAIARTWRSLSMGLPKTLPLPETPATLEQTTYRLERDFPLKSFNPDNIIYQHLYALVARALRLCDQRSVQQPPKQSTHSPAP